MLTRPFPVSDSMDFGLDVKTQVTITVDPLVLDDFKRELTTIPILRIMEKQNFYLPGNSRTALWRVSCSEA